MSGLWWELAGGAAAVAGATVMLPLAGFGAGGIAAGSLAAKAMSAAWTYQVRNKALF